MMLSDFVEVGERLGDGFVTPNCFPELAQIGVSEGHACRRGVVCTPRGLWGREPGVWGNHTSHRLRTWTVNPRGPGAGEARGRDCKYYSNKKSARSGNNRAPNVVSFLSFGEGEGNCHLAGFLALAPGCPVGDAHTGCCNPVATLKVKSFSVPCVVRGQ